VNKTGNGYVILMPEGIAVYHGGDPLAWVCLLCLRTSHNPNDVPEQWCACCGSREYPKECEHRAPTDPN